MHSITRLPTITEHVIVTATRNRLELLKRAIKSVVTQQSTNWKLIIVNDASTDGTGAYLDELMTSNPRIHIIHRVQSRGVNAARNAAFDLLNGNEVVSFLDDDDYLMDGALNQIAKTLSEMPSSVSVFFFNTYLLTSSGVREQGYRFVPGELMCAPTYSDLMTKKNLTGDCDVVFRSSLFTGKNAYRYAEDVNGFESELLLKMIRDGIEFRYLSPVVKVVDHSHEEPHLSEFAYQNDPQSFARAHDRIFSDHEAFFRKNPALARDRAIHAFKIALRARDFRLIQRFILRYLQFLSPVAASSR